MATHIAHIWWLPDPQTPSNAATKRVQFLRTLYLAARFLSNQLAISTRSLFKREIGMLW
jgi:hypothetical protein